MVELPFSSHARQVTALAIAGLLARLHLAAGVPYAPRRW